MRLLAIVLLAFAGMGSVAATAGARSRGPCDPQGSTTIRENSRARVFFYGETYYGCSYRSGRKVMLWEENHTSSCSCTVSQVRLKGDTVALQTVDEVPHMSVVWDSLLVVNLRLGRILLDHGLRRNREIAHLVLKANGSVGWLERDPARSIPSRPPTYRIRRHDERGFATLDAGTGAAAPHRIDLRRSTLYWTKAGRERHARLR